MEHIHEFKTKNLAWINVTKPAVSQINYLIKKYGLIPEDAAEALPPIQRPKLVERPGYLFMILLFPVYNRETKEISTEEVDFFIAKNRVITVHGNRIPIFKDLFFRCEKKPKNSPCSGDTANLLYEILNSLLNYCFPMIRHLNLDVEMTEKLIFKKYEKKQTVDTILRIKTNIFDFQRIMQSHEYVLNKLMAAAPRFFTVKKLKNNFLHLAEHAREITFSLQSFKDEINALHEANATLIEYRVNEIIKTLTIFSVIVFPLTLLAAIFGMNAQNTPIIGTAYDFWKILGIMFGSTLLMLGIFKWKKWI